MGIAHRISAFFHNTESRNILFYFISHAAITSGSALSTTTFIQAFLVEMGLSNAQIGVIGFTDSISLTAGSFFVVGLVAKVRNSARANAWSTLFYAFVPIAIVILTLSGNQNALFALYAICTVYALQNLGLAFKQSIYTKVLVNFIETRKLSKVVSVSSVIGNLLGILMGGISAAFMTLLFPYNFTLLFLTAAILLLIGTIVSSWCKEIYPDKPSAVRLEINPFKALWQLWKIAPSRVVLICHIMRGIHAAAMYYLVVVAVKHIQAPDAFLSYIFMTSTAATMLAAMFFGVAGRKIKIGTFYVAGTVLAGICLVFAVITQNMWIFLILNFLLMFGNMLTDISVPVGIYNRFDSDMLGSVTGARMFLTFAGRAVFTMILGLLLDWVSPWILFLVAEICQIGGAVLYDRYFERQHPMEQ